MLGKSIRNLGRILSRVREIILYRLFTLYNYSNIFRKESIQLLASLYIILTKKYYLMHFIKKKNFFFKIFYYLTTVKKYYNPCKSQIIKYPFLLLNE